MRLNLFGFGLLGLGLFILEGCNNKAYYYTNGATVENPNPGRRVAEPFAFEVQVAHADGKKMTVAVFFNRIPGEKFEEASVEFACPEFEVLVAGQKLKPLHMTCPTGKELLQLKQIYADFATPNGRPQTAVVMVPSIKVTTTGASQKRTDVPRYSVTFTLNEYDRSFGVR